MSTDWIWEDKTMSGKVNFYIPFKENQGMGALIKEFNESYPNIEVTLVPYNNNADGNTGVNTAIVGGQVDVLVSFNLANTNNRWANDLFIDLTDKVEEEGIDLVEQWGTDVYKYEDTIYTFPCGGEMTAEEAMKAAAAEADKAIEFIKERKDSDQPWMLSVNCYDPHPPYDAPLELVNKYLDRDLPDPNFTDEDIQRDKTLKKFFFQSSAQPVSDKLRRNKASYYGMIELVDKHYGRIIDALDEMGLRENTLIIYHSDHGEMLGDHGLTHKGCRFYEGLTHVPLIMSMPGTVAQGVRYDGITELTDIAPTIAEMCGYEMTDAHGRSLVPVLEGRPIKPRKFVRAEYYDTLEIDWEYDGLREAGEVSGDDADVACAYATMYYDGRYKLNVYHGSHYGELFDMENDPLEQDNLWEKPEYQKLKMELIMDSFDVSTKYSRPGQSRRGRY